MDKEIITSSELKSFLDSKIWKFFEQEVRTVVNHANANLMHEDHSVEIYRFQGRIQATMDLLEMPRKWLEDLIESESNKSDNSN